ncbi:MAG: hypothetical protein IK149_03870 [Oscillospiraceae bacterium]|nr:hypothetical protein [Oscillospiraceae bacterium]
MKRLLALLLCLVMALSLIPAAAAEDIEIIPIEEEPGEEEIVIVGEEEPVIITEPGTTETGVEGDRGSFGFTGLYIEPLYRGVITEEQLAEQLRGIEASAELNAPESNAVKYCSTMSAAGIYLRAQMVKRCDTVTFLIPEALYESSGNTGLDIYERAVIHSENRTPQEGDSLRWGSIGCGYSVSHLHDDEHGDCCQFTYGFVWTTTASQESTLTARVDSVMSALALDGKTERQKIRAIHDYICDNVDYDFEHLSEGADYPLQFSAYAAMVNGTAVCQGYAILFYRMAKEAGLDVRVVTSAEHAWNIVRIGSVYYNLDTTWDGQDAATTHDWYLKGMRDFTHYHHIREYPFYTDDFNAAYPMVKDSKMNQSNLYLSFTTTGKDTVTTYASSKPKVLIFGAAVTDSITDEFMKAFLDYKLTDVNVVFVDTTKKGSYDVKQFRNSVGGGDVRFCFDNDDDAADACFSYLRSFGYTLGTVQLPLIVFVDTDNKVQNFRVGAQGAATVAGLVKDFLGVTLSYGAPRITQQPYDQKLSSGTAKFSTQGLGFGALSYQWYYRTSGSGTWAKCSGTGSNAPTYKVSAAARRNGYQYRCAVGNAYGTTYTKTVTLYVQAPPVITQQPVDVKGKVGSTVTFSVKATGDELQYKWYYRDGSDIYSSWNACSGASAATATLSVEVKQYRIGYLYMCKIWNDVDTAWSQSGTLLLAGPTITTQPASVEAVAGDTARFRVTAADAAAYQWYYRTSSSGSWQACSSGGYNTDTYTVTAAKTRNGYQYRCKVSNEDGYVYTNAVTLTIIKKSAPAITLHPADALAAADSTATFTVGASGGNLSYQWYYRKSSTGSWIACSSGGYNTDTYSVKATKAREGYQYYCKVTNSLGTADSKPATLILEAYEMPTITLQPKSVTADVWDIVTFKVKATGGNLSYQWYIKTNSETGFGMLSETTESIEIQAFDVWDGMQIYCEVSNSLGTVRSETVTLTLRPYKAPYFDMHPSDVEASDGETVCFEVRASGGSLSYQWYYRTSSSGSWKKCSGSGCDTPSFEVKATAARNGYQYRCVVTNTLGTATSKTATLTVK